MEITHFVHQLWYVHRMTCRTRYIDFGKRRGTVDRMRDMRTVIWRVEIFPIPALRKDDVGSNAPRTWLLREVIRIVLGIHAWRIRTAAPVGLRIAAIALLHILAEAFRSASHRVTSEHTEARSEGSGCIYIG